MLYNANFFRYVCRQSVIQCAHLLSMYVEQLIKFEFR